MRSKQLTLEFRTWGGRRRGAGRPKGTRPPVPHRARPTHNKAHPVHVTLRSVFRPLRSRFVFPTLRGAIQEVNRRRPDTFRIVHFSVQCDHVHLIVEAHDKTVLARGVRGLSISIARRVNTLVQRRGRMWADRWHGRALATPRSVRNALAYVLNNFRKHNPEARSPFDMLSSAPDFAHFSELRGRTPREAYRDRVTRGRRLPASAIVLARSWLLRTGWLRSGALSIDGEQSPTLRSSERV
jgi:REP element-mobilizing transposase RayT